MTSKSQRSSFVFTYFSPAGLDFTSKSDSWQCVLLYNLYKFKAISAGFASQCRSISVRFGPVVAAMTWPNRLIWQGGILKTLILRRFGKMSSKAQSCFSHLFQELFQYLHLLRACGNWSVRSVGFLSCPLVCLCVSQFECRQRRIGNSVFPDHCGDDDPKCNKFSFYSAGHLGSSRSNMMVKLLHYKLYILYKILRASRRLSCWKPNLQFWKRWNVFELTSCFSDRHFAYKPAQ